MKLNWVYWISPAYSHFRISFSFSSIAGLSKGPPSRPGQGAMESRQIGTAVAPIPGRRMEFGIVPFVNPRRPSRGGRTGGDAMPRFVLLEHRRDGVHWDFMIEAGPALRTWAIDAPIAPEVPLPA